MIDFCKKIYELLKEPILYIATFIIIVITVAVSIPKSFGLPDGILDSVILILTLLGLFIDSSDNSDLQNSKKKIINYLFRIESFVEFLFRFTVVLVIFAIIFLSLYIIISNEEGLHKLGFTCALLAIPYLLVTFGLHLYYDSKKEEKKEEKKDIKPESIYYIYLLLIYCSALLQKF